MAKQLFPETRILVIPSRILADDGLNSTDKLLYGYLYSVRNHEDTVYINYEPLAELFGLTKTSVYMIVKRLARHGHLTSTRTWLKTDEIPNGINCAQIKLLTNV
jgi:DNA-binding MarR family transcriptional regulator